MNQEKKKQIVKNLKAALKGTNLKYGIEWIPNHSTLSLIIKSGPYEFIQNHIDVVGQSSKKPMTWLDVFPKHNADQFSGKCLDVLTKILAIMNAGNHYQRYQVEVRIGKWNVPYQLVK